MFHKHKSNMGKYFSCRRHLLGMLTYREVLYNMTIDFDENDTSESLSIRKRTCFCKQEHTHIQQ